MAKNQTSQVAQNTTEEDLLSGASASGNGTTEAAAGTPTAEEVAAIEAEIAAAQQKIKELRAKKKGEKVKNPRVLKGQMVAFRNKAGELITGLGQMYYVTRHGGKLHYKEASAVTILPEGWKEGDAIPGMEEPAATA